MNYQAVVFDLDGTLIDSLEDLAASGNEMLALYGGTPHTADEYRYLVGDGSEKLMERLLPRADAATIKKALESYKEIYARHLFDHTRPYDGIPELLAQLKRRGVKTAVCTNKHQSAAAATLETLFLPDDFAAFTGVRPGIPRKPDPASLLSLLETLRVKPEATAYLGDTAVDMETAVRAGALPIGVLWGFRSREELVESGAKVLLESPLDLLETIPLA